MKKKKIFITIAIIAVVLIAGYFLLLYSGKIGYWVYSIQHAGTESCTFGNWQTVDYPELAEEWQRQLKNTGLELRDVSGYGVGEGTDCVRYTWMGPTYYDTPPGPDSAGQIGVEASIHVNDVSDDAELGDVVIKMLSAFGASEDDRDMGGVSIRLTFVGNGSKNLLFDSGTAQKWLDQGLSNAQLIQALDGRSIPSTVTPAPTDG